METGINFTDAEVREELAHLGYNNVPDEKLAEFKKDLVKLIQEERNKSGSLNNSNIIGSDSKSSSYVNSKQDNFDMKRYTNYGASNGVSTYRENWRYQGRPFSAGNKYESKYENLFRPVGNFSQSNQPIQTSYPSQGSFSSNINFNLQSEYSTVPKPTYGYQSSYTGKSNYSFKPDDYTKPGYTVIPTGSRYSSQAFATRLQDSNVMSEEDMDADVSATDRDDEISVTDSEKRFMKRKTLRKNKTGNKQIDESTSESEFGGPAGGAQRDCGCVRNLSTSSLEKPCNSCRDDKTGAMIVCCMAEPPHTRNLVKCSPFQRHQMYLKAWNKQPPIGDNNHLRTRRKIHAKMLCKDEIDLPKKVYVPNTYVPPPSRPRYDLRFEIRRRHLNYEMPPHGFYHEA